MIRQLTVRIIRMHIAIENTFDRIAITCVLRSSRMYRFIYDAQSITQFFQVVNEKIEFLYNICICFDRKISIFLSIMKKHSDYIRILTLLVDGDTMPKIKKRKFRNFGNFDIIDNQK